MNDILDDKKDLKKYMRDTITYVVNKKMNTFTLKLDYLAKKIDQNIEYTTYIIEHLNKNNFDSSDKIVFLENQLNDMKNYKNIIQKNKNRSVSNKCKELNNYETFSDSNDISENIIIENNVVEIIKENYTINKNIDTYKEIKSENYDLDINFIKNCLHQNSIDGEIELFKKIYIDNISKEFYPIRHIKKKYQYWKDNKMNDDDTNGTYIKNTIINNIEQSYFSVNTIEEYSNDIEQFIKNQEYIIKLNEQKYKDKFFSKIIGIINI
jgi:hypothetical protein